MIGRFVVLRHEPFEHLGSFASVLDEHQIAYDYYDFEHTVPEDGYDGVIVMGGPMSANDDLPGLRKEMRLIDKVLQEDVPMLGICLGSQMIAKALGAPVYRNAELEIGWEPVWLTEAGKADPLFRGVPSPETFFHWHGETFDLPEGAELLAYSKKCRHQAYRWGKRVYGIQFHPEITAEMIDDWCSQPVNCGDVAITGPIDARAHDPAKAAQWIFREFLCV